MIYLQYIKKKPFKLCPNERNSTEPKSRPSSRSLRSVWLRLCITQLISFLITAIQSGRNEWIDLQHRLRCCDRNMIVTPLPNHRLVVEHRSRLGFLLLLCTALILFHTFLRSYDGFESYVFMLLCKCNDVFGRMESEKWWWCTMTMSERSMEMLPTTLHRIDCIIELRCIEGWIFMCLR